MAAQAVTSVGLSYPLVKEIIEAIQPGKSTTAQKLVSLGLAGPTAIELAAQINARAINPRKLAALGIMAAQGLVLARFVGSAAPDPGLPNSGVVSPPGGGGVVVPPADTIAPLAPFLNALSTPTSNNRPTISGVAEPGSTVTLYDNGGPVGTAIAGASGGFNLTVPVLRDGSHVFTATARDTAGNISAAAATVSLVVDATAPHVPIITTLTGTTTNLQPLITGTAEAGALVTITANGLVLGTILAVGGAFFFTPPAPLSPGSYALVATATDVVGNVSLPSASVTVTLVIVTPGPTGIPLLDVDGTPRLDVDGTPRYDVAA